MSCSVGLAVIFSVLGVATCAEYCTTDYNWATFTYTYEYCSYDCCGTWPNEYCCGFYTWGIAVSVVGGIILLSCVIGCICCCVQQSGKRGQVIQPQPQPGVTVFHTQAGGQPYGYGYQQPAMGPGNQMPPAYGNQAAPPYTLPGQSSADPAYPPPPVQKP